MGKRDLEKSRKVLLMWQLRRRSEHAYVGMARILIYNNTWYNNHFNLTPIIKANCSSRTVLPKVA